MKKLLWLALILFNGHASIAQQSLVNEEAGVALQGYDLLSYFNGKPLQGNKEAATTYEGVSYWFSNKENLKKFELDPSKYLPQYGGWCAYAMGLNGEQVPVDPKTYKIINGRLYLFYNAFLNNTLKKWNQNEDALLQKADSNWNNLINHSDHE